MGVASIAAALWPLWHLFRALVVEVTHEVMVLDSSFRFLRFHMRFTPAAPLFVKILLALLATDFWDFYQRF